MMPSFAEQTRLEGITMRVGTCPVRISARDGSVFLWFRVVHPTTTTHGMVWVTPQYPNLFLPSASLVRKVNKVMEENWSTVTLEFLRRDEDAKVLMLTGAMLCGRRLSMVARRHNTVTGKESGNEYSRLLPNPFRRNGGEEQYPGLMP